MTGLTRHLLLLLATLIFGISGIAEPVNADTSIAVLIGDSLTSTLRTLHGAHKVISRSQSDVSFHTFSLTQNPEDAKAVIDSIKTLSPRLILTIGSPATRFAKKELKDIPIVFGAVLYPALSGFVESASHPGENITGASLNIPTHIQFKYFKKIVPNMSKLGVMYTDATASLIPPARVVAQDMGLSLKAIKIENEKQIPTALDSLANSVDGIWSVADPELFTQKSTRYILLNALRKGIPFMGFSHYVVESGALFALDFDYKSVGYQAGKIANRVLDGESPGNIRVSVADVIWFHYNEKTAHHINIEIPEGLVAIAKEVYR